MIRRAGGGGAVRFRPILRAGGGGGGGAVHFRPIPRAGGCCPRACKKQGFWTKEGVVNPKTPPKLRAKKKGIWTIGGVAMHVYTSEQGPQTHCT